MTNSQAVAHESWLVRCSHYPSRFRRSNPHIINHDRYPILLPRRLPGRHIPTLATYTPNSALPVSQFLANFHRDTAKNDQSTTTVHQEEPSAPSPLLEIAPHFPLHSVLPHSHPEGTCNLKRPWCSTLKNFSCRLSPLFSTCEPPNYNPSKKTHCNSNSPMLSSTLHPPPSPRKQA